MINAFLTSQSVWTNRISSVWAETSAANPTAGS